MAIAKHKTRGRELREGRALARRVKRGDRAAFELLYASYEARLYRVCHRLTGSDAAAAALAETAFVHGLESLPEGGPDAIDVPAHLAATARGLAARRHVNGGGPWLDPVPGEHASEVGAANQRLAPRQRMVLALRDLEGRSDDEIALALGTAAEGVGALVARARGRLRAELHLPGAIGSCRERVPELSAYLDGTLPAARRAGLEAHVAECAGCRAELFSLQEAALRYRDLPVPVPPGELRSRTTVALGAIGFPTRRPRALAADPSPAGAGRPKAAALAMAGLVVLGAVVTIAVSSDLWTSGESARPAAPPAPPAPAAGRVVVAATGGRAAAPPPLRHVRGGRLRPAATARPSHRRLPPPNAGTPDFAPAPAPAPPSPPPAATSPPVTQTQKPSRAIPVEILPPVTPAHSPATADVPPPAAQAPSDPAQTTST